ncbi:MAG TPA: TrmH family RNA methyltransferase [Bacteroidota bacterium]|nr:TrmH family RNA methyltransferase [Bacteroidota bacterium]
MTERRREKLLGVIRRRQPTLTVVMEDIHDPHNVSAVLRSADAAGVMEVQLLYTREKFPRLGKKSSASAVKWVARRKFGTVKECYDTLRAEGFTIYATRLAGEARSLFDLDLTGRVALVFGNEHRGVSDEAAERADGLLLIPMNGMIQSLNVSVACAVCLYEALRQRTQKGMYRVPQLDEPAVAALLDRWSRP